MALRDVLEAHFVMWHDVEGRIGGEWRCACGLRFGFSDSAIDHQAFVIREWATNAESLDRFRTAWEEADAAGVRGGRVLVGLVAALNGEPATQPDDGRRWLTPAGCAASGGHKVHCPFCAQCTVCFVVLSDVPT